MMDNENLSNNVETMDNSTNEIDTDALIDELLEEPNENSGDDNKGAEPPKVEEQSKDNAVKYPEKFLENGELNADKLVEAYLNLEKHSSQQSAQRKAEQDELNHLRGWYQQQAQQAQQDAQRAGYESVQDWQVAKEIASYEANEYSKYLGYIEDPEERAEVQQLLIDYEANPSKTLLGRIEMEFAPEINKSITLESYRRQQQYENQKLTSAETQKMTNIESVISQSVDANRELFDNEAFNSLFVNTLYKYGDNFTFEDATALMDMVKQMQQSAIDAYTKSLNVKKDNDNATDKLASITGTNANTNQANKRLGDMSPAELDKYLDSII
jgi:hypothetical protein